MATPNRLILGLLIAAALIGPARANTVVTLRPSVEINRAAVLLSDVFAGVPEGIDRPIAIAPLPGKSVTYDVRVLTKLAEQYRLEWKATAMTEQAVLTRAATRITADMIRDAVAEKLPMEKIKGKVDITFDNRSLEVNLPADREAKFTLANFNYDQLSRRFRAELQAETGATPPALQITGRVFIKRDVPVLAKRLDAGTTVGEADIDWLTVPEERITNDTITDARSLVGRELRRETAEGQMLRLRDVIPPRLVTRGSLVTMRVETPYMLVTAQGRAMQDGAYGEVVRLTNTQSNRVVEGTVTGAGIVRVPTAQKMAMAQ